MNEAGQSSLGDAMLFFLTLSVASALLLIYASMSIDAEASLAREAGLRYVAGARVAILRSTMENATYDYGGPVMLGTVTVERWILEQLAMLGKGVGAAGFEIGNLRVWHLARWAIRADYDFALLGRTDQANVTIASEFGHLGETAPRYESSWTYPVPSVGGPATITLSVWRST